MGSCCSYLSTLIYGSTSERYYPIASVEPSQSKANDSAQNIQLSEKRSPSYNGADPSVDSSKRNGGSSINAQTVDIPIQDTKATTPTGGKGPSPSANKSTFYMNYELKDEIGVGSTSKCYRCCRKSDGKEFACKVIDKRQVEMKFSGLLDQFNVEIKVLKALNHPNIIHLEDTFDTADRIYMVMELMRGGELFDYVVDKGTLSEEEASIIVRKITSAVQHMHRQNIIHRDLKPENLLLTTRDGQPEVKLIDFGLAKIMQETVASSFLGTKGYLAPEMLQRHSYDKAIDMWALGVIVFVLLCGCLPFDDDSSRIASESAARKKFTLRFPKWASGLSASAKDLLHNLLEIDPKHRFTADQAMVHPWVSGKTVQIDNYLQSPCVLGERRKEMRSPLPPTYIQDMYDTVAQRGGYPTVRATYGAGIAAAVPPRHPTGANVTVTYYNRTGAPGPEEGYGSTGSSTRARKNSI